jgi:CBS domain-containing protein
VRILLRHNLKSVPVVAGDRVVGIVARRDPLRLIARGDDDVRADLERRLKEEIDALQRITVEVADGLSPSTLPVARSAGSCSRASRTPCPAWSRCE